MIWNDNIFDPQWNVNTNNLGNFNEVCIKKCPQVCTLGSPLIWAHLNIDPKWSISNFGLPFIKTNSLTNWMTVHKCGIYQTFKAMCGLTEAGRQSFNQSFVLIDPVISKLKIWTPNDRGSIKFARFSGELENEWKGWGFEHGL